MWTNYRKIHNYRKKYILNKRINISEYTKAEQVIKQPKRCSHCQNYELLRSTYCRKITVIKYL